MGRNMLSLPLLCSCYHYQPPYSPSYSGFYTISGNPLWAFGVLIRIILLYGANGALFLFTVKGHYRRHVSPYSQGSPGNTIEALSLLTVKSHREILYKYSLGWFMGPLWSHTCFAGSIHTLLVQYALSWIHTHLPPFSA